MDHPLCLQRSVRLSVEELCSVGAQTAGKALAAKFEHEQYSTPQKSSGFWVLGSWCLVLGSLDLHQGDLVDAALGQHQIAVSGDAHVSHDTPARWNLPGLEF